MKCSKVGFLCLVLFYGCLNHFVRLCGFIVVNDVANCGRLGDSLGHREHIYIWFPRTILHCWFIKLNFLTHAML